MNLQALNGARQDLVAQVFSSILAGWMQEPGVFTWKSHLEVAYHNTKKLGTTIGLFSNLAAQLGKQPDDMPLFQVQAERLPFHLANVEGWRPNFGLNEYLGDAYQDCVAFLAPFLTYAGMLYNSPKNKLWSVEVGDRFKQEPLILTFATGKSLVKLAVWGHVLTRDASLINDNTLKPQPVSVRDDYWASNSLEDYSEEQIIAEISRDPNGRRLYNGNLILGGPLVIGTYSNPRIENGLITVDVNLIEPKEYADCKLWLVISHRQVRDPKRSLNKYKKRYITPHRELEVRLLKVPNKEADHGAVHLRGGTLSEIIDSLY